MSLNLMRTNEWKKKKFVFHVSEHTIIISTEIRIRLKIQSIQASLIQYILYKSVYHTKKKRVLLYNNCTVILLLEKITVPYCDL